MTFYEYHCAREAYLMRYWREKEYARDIMHVLYLVNTTEKPPKTAAELWPLPIDPKPEKKAELSEEKKQELFNIAQERIKNLNFSTK